MDDSETADYEGKQTMKKDPSSVANDDQTRPLETDQQFPSISSAQSAGTHTNLSTDLALERSAMAAERTLMASIRTSIAMISFGFALGKLRDAIGSPQVRLIFGRTTDVMSLAYFLVILGTVLLIVSAIHFKIETATLLKRGLKRQPRIALIVAVLLSLLGLFTFADLVSRF